MKSGDLRILLDTVRSQGAEISHTGGGHLRIRNPENGKTVISSSTNPRGRGHQNFRADLRRAGFDLSREHYKKKKEHTMPEQQVNDNSIALDMPAMPATASVVDIVRQHPEGIAPRAVAEMLGVTRHIVSDRLRRAERHGEVRHEGQTKATLYFPMNGEHIVVVEEQEPEEDHTVLDLSQPPKQVPVTSDRVSGILSIAEGELADVEEAIVEHTAQLQALVADRDRLVAVIAAVKNA